MPDKGWRKRLQDKRPKTPVQSKPVSANTPVADETTNDPVERDHLQGPDKKGWRKTYHGSRPQTPIGAPTTASAGGETEETRSEVGSETTAPRRRSAPKPKLSRYLSDYLSLTASSKSPELSEPWSEERPLIIEPPLDPFVVVQAVRFHICNSSQTPIPVPHNSGILRVFEDYRKVREQKERLDGLLHETLEGYRTAEESWAREKGSYQDEIRRLELIIARGTSGMAGLIQARQGTIVNHRRAHQKTLSSNRLETAYEFLTQDQLDERIRLSSQKVIFHRPSSPSSKMTALSSQFSNTSPPEELRVGTPPKRGPNMTLSRKVKSELDLAKIAKLDPSNTQAPSVYSGFSVSGDPLPDEEEPLTAAAVDPGIESEAFVALRELAILVARRRGIDADRFHNNLLNLYSSAEETGDRLINTEIYLDEKHALHSGPTHGYTQGNARFSEHNLRRFQSQPHLAMDQKRRRHFSFEPGDDGALEGNLDKYGFNRPKSPAGSQSTISSEGCNPHSDLLSQHSTSGAYTFNAEALRPSKIPSPVNRPTMGRVRRENSASSLQSVRSRFRLDDRRDSRSSVMTAFRQNSSGSLRRPRSTSRSSSFNNLHLEKGQQLKDPSDNLRLRSSVVALAAARAAGTTGSSASESKNTSPVKGGKRQSSARSSSIRTDNVSERWKSSENEIPQKRS